MFYGSLSKGAGYPSKFRKTRQGVHMKKRYTGKGNTSKITRPVAIRIKNEVAEYFRRCAPLNKAVNELYLEIERGNIEVSKEGELKIRGMLKGVPQSRVRDLELIGQVYDMTFTDLFNELYRALDEGEIDLEGGHFTYLGKKEE